MINQEAQLETMEQDYGNHAIMFLCKGYYTLKRLPPNIRALSAFSLAACVGGIVGEGQLRGGEEGSVLGTVGDLINQLRLPSVELN